MSSMVALEVPSTFEFTFWMGDRIPTRRAMLTVRWEPISMLSWAKTVFSELWVARMRVTSSASGGGTSDWPSGGSHVQVGMASSKLIRSAKRRSRS